MKWTIAGLLILGLVAAASAAVLVASFQAPVVVEQAQPETVDEVEIVVASRALPAMTVVDASAVTMKTVPAEERPPGSLQSAQAAIGKVLVAPLVEGQPFTRGAFAREGSGVHLASVLQQGKRAMSVSLTDHTGLDGLLYPGSLVDVIASFRAPSLDDGTRGSDQISTVLLEAIQVLAVEDRTIVSNDEEQESGDRRQQRQRRRIVTLLVDSRQAEALQLASAHGNISLVLRNPLDVSSVEERGTSISDLSRLYAERLSGIRPSPIDPDDLARPGDGELPEAIPGQDGSETSQAQGEGEAKELAAKAEEAEEKRQPWKTVVMRGRRSETLAFPITEE